MQDLSGPWMLSQDGGSVRVEMAVPGDAITALQAAGAIADPYWGRNEYATRWVAEADWTLQRRFVHAGGKTELVIDGLDTLAEVSLNGHVVLQAANAFRRWRVDVSDSLIAGENEISIRFPSAVAEAARRQAAQPFFVPYSSNNCPIPHGNMLRKPACDFGWDWNIALASFGIWGEVKLEPMAGRIADVVVSQVHQDGAAVVSVTVLCERMEEGADVAASLCGVAAVAKVSAGKAHLTLWVENPVLWWPNGLGDAVLHDLVISCGVAKTTRKIGLRDLALISEPDAAGRSFGFRVNGFDVFAKGANWIPADALSGRISQGAVRDLLISARDAHMNMIRIWGGGRYEPDWFYDLCSELGLMVWQDFMFACNLYPSTPEFLAEVAAEVRDVVRRLNHHACIAVWCGDNELIGALTWFPESRADRDRYLVSYDRLNRTIEQGLAEVLPGANWWPSSPSPGVLSFGDAWHDDSSGDMHFWSVWHEGRDFDHYRDVKPRFCSEFGFQSYPSMEAIRRFSGPEDFNIAAPVMESHQKNAGGNARIAETMFRYFRFPVDFENFVYLSQVQQGLAIKTAVTQWRGLKPHCQGTLIWQLNDTWPVCSWASLDHGGNWKLLHHMAAKFFAPLSVVAMPEAGDIVLRGVNDRREPCHLTVTARAVTMTGQIRDLGKGTALVAGAATELLRMSKSALAEDEILTFIWETADGLRGGDHFAPRPYKYYDLLPPELDLQADGNRLTISSQQMALFVAVEADVPGRFSNNAFTVFPGYPAEITFTPRDPGRVATFTLRDLHSATYGPR